MFVVVIVREDHSTPTVVGPFDTSEKAIGFANTVGRFVDGSVKYTELEAVPPDYE